MITLLPVVCNFPVAGSLISVVNLSSAGDATLCCRVVFCRTCPGNTGVAGRTYSYSVIRSSAVPAASVSEVSFP